MPTSRVFADTSFWIAKINPDDNLSEQAASAEQTVTRRTIVTSEEVLTEVLNYFAGRSQWQRQAAVQLIDELLVSSEVEIIPQSHESFMVGFELYKQRMDKGFSLTDCISMQAMSSLSLRDVLTHDHHFHQAGFTLLMALH